MAADLRVIRVIHHFAGLSPALREFEVRDAAQALDEVLALRAATSAWIDTVLGHALPQSQLEVQRGDYVDLTCERALQLEAALIVVSPSQRLRDSSVESIATFSNTPVLVARWRAETSPLVVAATDLEDVGFPVLRAAAELARVLGASLVPVHNVSPLPA
ncbi:MAG TPA: hypothetical protein VFX59_22290, partial [Polyangiales bacterium]|nr:hypothetical protein [Polyangiales bacterium]